jgi:16S rRNA processing protein RimM
VVKPHGLRGEVVVSFVSNRPERARAGSVFVTDDGDLVIDSAQPLGTRFLVRFAGVTTFERAEQLRGTVLRAAPLHDEDAWWVHELVGAEMVDEQGAAIGLVRAVLANPASDLLELDTGALVPLRFVVGRSPGRIVVDLPAGLLDLPEA